MTLTRSDERVAAYIAECGMEGYGFFWVVLETVALAMDKTGKCDVCYPLTYWVTQGQLHRTKVRKYFDVLQKNKLIELNLSSSFIGVKIIKIFDRRNDRPSAEVWMKIRSKIFKRDDYTCQYCGERGKKLECDHVHPVSKGGNHDESNLVTACFRCNRSKRSKTLQEWIG